MDPILDKRLAHLMNDAQKGNQGAYRSFLLEASVVLRAFISKRMKEADQVEDVLQDTLLAIHRARHTHIPGRPVGPWAYAICSHRITDFYRRHRRVERVKSSLPQELAPPAPSPEEDSGHLRQLLGQMLSLLPEKQRKIVSMLKTQDLSVREVASQMGMTESAVKVSAFRAYETIRRALGVTKQ